MSDETRELSAQEAETLKAVREAAAVGAFSQPKGTARLNIVYSMYWQRGHEPAEDVPSRFGRGLTSPTRPYRQEVVIHPHWTKVETGWVADPAYLVLVNNGADAVSLFLLPPDPEAGCRDAWSDPVPKKVPTLVLPPGESQPLSPAPGVEVWAVSSGAGCPVTVVAVGR